MVNEKMISNLPSPLLAVDEPLAAVQALVLQFGLSVEGIMAVHRQWAVHFSVDSPIPPLPGHVEGVRGVHTQTL